MDGFKVSYALNQRNTDIKWSKEYFARIQLPFWLASTTWDFHVRQACNGWQIFLRSRTVRPFGDDILHILKEGSSAELFRKLIHSSQGLHDSDERGNTLLHVRISLNTPRSIKLTLLSTQFSVVELTLL